MTRLANIRIEDVWSIRSRARKEIRLDWDNDRHQIIELRGDSPELVLRMFREAAQLIINEVEKGNI